MAMSENSVKILNYLKENAGAKVTAADVAEALGLDKRQVDGAFTAMQRKELGARVEAEVAGTAEVSFLVLTGATAEEGTTLSENAQKVIAYLESVAGEHVTLDDVANGLEMDKRVVSGTFNGLVKKGLAARETATVEAPVKVKYLTLTETGMAFDPTAPESK